MKVYTQSVRCTPNAGCTSHRIKYGHPQEGETQDDKRQAEEEMREKK